jgi:hypothetical protein
MAGWYARSSRVDFSRGYNKKPFKMFKPLPRSSPAVAAGGCKEGFNRAQRLNYLSE